MWESEALHRPRRDKLERPADESLAASAGGNPIANDPNRAIRKLLSFNADPSDGKAASNIDGERRSSCRPGRWCESGNEVPRVGCRVWNGNDGHESFDIGIV